MHERSARPSDAWEPPSPKALAAAWAAHFPARNVTPKTGDRGTVGGFDDAQLKVLHGLFFSAPPGAELADITKLVKQHPAFKGTDVTDSRLQLVTKYRPESFPFTWAQRKQSFCSFVAVQALAATPSDVAAMKVLAELRKQFDGFLSEPVIGRLARGAWKSDAALFPFVKGKLTERPDASGYVLACTGEREGLPRNGDRVALSAQLAHQVSGYVDDPRVKFDTDLQGLLELISSDLGEPFSESQLKHLGAKFPAMPNFNDIHTGARRRFANLARTVWADRKPGSVGELERILKAEHGYAPLSTSGWSVLRNDFPDLIPRFGDDKAEELATDAQRFAAEVKRHPGLTLNQVGARLGLDALRTGAVVRQLRLSDPAALPPRKSDLTFTAAEKKQLHAAAESIPPGATLFALVDELEASQPQLLEKYELDDGRRSREVLQKQLGIENWQAHQRDRIEAVLVKVASRADDGVTLADLHAQLRDEHGVEASYTLIKQLVRTAEASPKEHPALAALKKAGRYPWDVGFELTETLARQLAAAMVAQPDATLGAVVASLKKSPTFAAKYPTFSVTHVAKLRAQFPDLVPYVDDLKTAPVAAETKRWVGELDALAKKAKQAVRALPKGSTPSIAGLSRTLGVDYRQLYRAVTRHPEDFPWFRRAASGNVDLQLAYRVAAALEKAPLGTTREQLTAGLSSDPSFRERYPAFNVRTLDTLRELYPKLVPGWFDRHQLLRSVTLAEALRTAPKGASLASVAAKLNVQHPGLFDGAFATKVYLEQLWASDPRRYAFAAGLLTGPGLVGRGEKPGAAVESVSSVATRAARLEGVPPKLDLVETLVAGVKDKPLDSGRRYEFVLVQHLLDTQLPTFDALKRLGMSPARTSVIGTPYSASDLVVESLEDKGWDVRVPPLDMATWVEDVRDALYERLESALANHRDVVAMDDGGIISELVTTDPVLSRYRDRFRIVEQTRRGITVADHVDVAAPVVNVAQSWAKFVEGPMIARSIDGKLVERLNRLGVTSLKGRHVGVIGAGTIGLPIAESLRALGAKVTVLDTSDAALGKAKARDFDATADRQKFFSGQEIIIGATGVQSVTKDDLQWLKDGAIIGSASSKLVEIDVPALAAADPNEPAVVDADSHPPSVQYDLPGGRRITLLARGFPLNFDGQAENIAPEEIQLTRALMVLGLLQATQEKVAGVRRVDVKRELQLLEAFEELGAGNGDAEVKKVLEHAMKQLRAAIEKPGTHYKRHE
ncbi:MAG: NAD-binding protein [Myxococcaceae bacterium]|nr:NAD-binding protein [Myxococcaceae bacterium]